MKLDLDQFTQVVTPSNSSMTISPCDDIGYFHGTFDPSPRPHLTFHIRGIPAGGYRVFCAYEGLMKHYWKAKGVNADVDRVIYSLLFLIGTLFGIFGSLVILYGVRRNAVRLDNISTVLIQHVAILDFLATSVIILPTFLTSLTDQWLFGAQFCVFQAFAKYYIMGCSALLVCALNCSKLLMILYPLRVTSFTSRHGHFLAGSLWVVVAVMYLIYHYQTGLVLVWFRYVLLSCDFWFSATMGISGAITLMAILSISTLIIIVSGAWLIKIAVRKSKLQGRAVNKQGIVTVILVSAFYCISFGPFIIFLLVSILWRNDLAYFEVFCRNVPCVNYVCNVFIYYACLRTFRGFLRRMFVRCVGVVKWRLKISDRNPDAFVTSSL